VSQSVKSRLSMNYLHTTILNDNYKIRGLTDCHSNSRYTLALRTVLRKVRMLLPQSRVEK